MVKIEDPVSYCTSERFLCLRDYTFRRSNNERHMSRTQRPPPFEDTIVSPAYSKAKEEEP